MITHINILDDFFLRLLLIFEFIEELLSEYSTYGFGIVGSRTTFVFLFLTSETKIIEIIEKIVQRFLK